MTRKEGTDGMVQGVLVAMELGLDIQRSLGMSLTP